jgi:hypothetical protein
MSAGKVAIHVYSIKLCICFELNKVLELTFCIASTKVIMNGLNIELGSLKGE